jgi:hypothetical protein
MSDTDCKKKMISLRLSQVEYEILKTKYRAYGTRNVSELARLALHRIVAESAGPQNDFAARLSELDDRVSALESQLAFVAKNGSL